SNPILTPGPAAWDANSVLHCSIVRDNKGFKLYDTGEAAPGYAFRSIGLDGPPLIQPDKPYDRGYCQGPSVIYQAESKSYFEYYNGAAAGYPTMERVTLNLAVFPAADLAKLRLLPAP